MSDPVQQAPADAAAAVAASSAASGQPPAPRSSVAEALPVGGDFAQEHPEALVAGAFAGAFIVARILKHITSE